ncbi:hypothetical protein AWM75_08145 [Aerococcus urinaehominis]|uniref:ATPase dynein-related AAA domain-containing protein n=1 Tax=Aerococcus urinaehominis TaxID=128944 RepID=A0A109RH17_9LACT|nr:AAA family ATPase [Aerococcus urinaehominis]AMB99941.1 hypothetical protein AWM75_08145 [Aerococcus urinaehominis]
MQEPITSFSDYVQLNRQAKLAYLEDLGLTKNKDFIYLAHFGDTNHFKLLATDMFDLRDLSKKDFSNVVEADQLTIFVSQDDQAKIRQQPEAYFIVVGSFRTSQVSKGQALLQIDQVSQPISQAFADRLLAYDQADINHVYQSLSDKGVLAQASLADQGQVAALLVDILDDYRHFMDQVQTEADQLQAQMTVLGREMQTLAQEEAKLQDLVQDYTQSNWYLPQQMSSQLASKFATANQERLAVDGDLIAKLQGQLYAQAGLLFTEDKLAQVVTSLLANELTILVGPSGTGKSALVKGLAQVMGEAYLNVPVQTTWVDRQDLLGFYNPITNNYQNSALVDFILEAAQPKNSHKFYFVNLDELNLSQIENYFADFLSICDQDQPTISLYSRQVQQGRLTWLANLLDQLDQANSSHLSFSDQVSRQQLIDQVHNLKTYSADLKLPKNLRFFGTMNTEGYVQPLSPKVIDRAYLISLDQVDFSLADHLSQVQPVNLVSHALIDYQPDGGEGESQDYLQAVADYFEQNLQLSISARLAKHRDKYWTIGSQLDRSAQDLRYDLVSLKFLPKIHLPSQDHPRAGQDLQSLLGESRPELTSKIDQMAAGNGLFTYWS